MLVAKRSAVTLFFVASVCCGYLSSAQAADTATSNKSVGSTTTTVSHTATDKPATAISTSRRFERLTSYEPVTFGMAWDDVNDGSYFDFRLSLKYALFDQMYRGKTRLSQLPHFYIAFTGHFSQYIGTRESAPVISRKLSPRLFARYWGDNPQKYMDVAYVHESNGQSITEAAAFEDEQENADRERYAIDKISRGWDYLAMELKNPWRDRRFTQGRYRDWDVYYQFKYFLESGLLQDKPEEVNSWEPQPGVEERKKVDGLSVLIKHSIDSTGKTPIGRKWALRLTTGYDDPFRFNSTRLEYSFEYKNLPPIMLWWEEGYAIDAARYNRRHSMGGLAIEIR